MNGRHFAEEYVRRKKLADKGQFEKQPAASTSSGADSKSGSGGWNEVAKKGSSSSSQQQKQEETMPYKMVASKKKGKR